MMKAKLLMVIPITIFIITIASFGAASLFEEIKKTDKIIQVHAQWDEASSDLSGLIDKSDLVVVAKPYGEKYSYQPFEGMEDTFTDVKLKVLKILKGNPTSSIVLSQYGGTRPDGTIEQWDFHPLLDNDEYYLLFLTEIKSDTERDEKYEITNGIEGYFKIVSDSPEKLEYLVDEDTKSLKDEEKDVLKSIKFTSSETSAPSKKEVVEKNYLELLELFN